MGNVIINLKACLHCSAAALVKLRGRPYGRPQRDPIESMWQTLLGQIARARRQYRLNGTVGSQTAATLEIRRNSGGHEAAERPIVP